MKEIICIVLPLAAFVGTWIGFAASGGIGSQIGIMLLLLFALCFLFGFWGYYSSERTRLNRAREYR
ncbi:MAG TPA: hypothetical protein VFK37_03140 [Bacillales bacterium]|nr:hypothetical protein [Bacillales bacterium]